jgi:CheY-like chemotaxis protein
MLFEEALVLSGIANRHGERSVKSCRKYRLQSRDTSEARGSSINLEKPFVLVADDNDATCTLITALLQHDFHVETASDGAEAIVRLKSRRYAAIVLDLRMPQVDGFGVLAYLRDERPEMISRVMVVTAALSPREMQRVHAYEICSVIAKPFEIDELLAMVKECAALDETGGLGGQFFTSGMLFLIADLLRQRLM